MSTAEPTFRNTRRFASVRTVVAMMLREMTQVYGRSPGGYLWAVLQPVAAIALLSYAFSLILRAPSLGTIFPLFYATGYLPFVMFQEVSTKTAQAVRFSRTLLSFGAVTWTDMILARFVLNAMTHVVVIAIVLTGLAIFFPMPGAPDFPHLMNGVAMAAALALGVGVMNCFLISILPLWEQVWQVLTRPLFLISGVFFVLEDIPSNYRDILWWNPLFHSTGEVRRAVYPTYAGDYVSSVYVYGISTALLMSGLFLLYRFQDHILDQ